MKTRIAFIVVVFIASVLFVVGLNAFSIYISSRPNGFIRRLPPFAITADWLIDLKKTDKQFSGYEDSQLFLGSPGRGHFFSRLNLKTRYLDSVSVTGPQDLRVYGDAFCHIDSSGVYVFDGSAGRVWEGKRLQLDTSFKTPYFTAATPISPHSYIVRCVNGKGTNALMKLTADTMVVNAGLLQKQVDGIFCTDGILAKVPGTDKIMYVYYYRNQFICADTNLNLQYRGKTIDTVSTAKISVGSVRSTKEVTLSSPPRLVNKQAAVNNKYLFIRSALKADNERQEIMEYNAVIDVYEISDGKYKFSFYIPDFNGHKLRDFRVVNNHLIGLFGQYLYVFKIRFD